MNIGFPRTRAGENAPEPFKLEITVKPEKNVKQKAAGQSDAAEQSQVTEATARIIYTRDKDDDKCRDKDDDKDDDKKTKKFVCPERYCKSNVITVKSCDDLVCYDLGEYDMEQNGFVLELSIKLKNVCPKRHTGLAVILYELDECDKEYPRGFKTVLIPPTGKCFCDDICVACLHFVVPAGLDVSGDCHPCGPRRFVARYIVNYVDSDFSVCGCVDKH